MAANPIGQHVNGGHWTYEIIGVVGNAKSRTLGEDTRPILYRSLDQSIVDDASLMGYTLVVHTRGNPAALAEAVRRQVYALDPAMAIYNEETMEEHIRSAYFLPRIAAALFGVFGSIGLVLAAIGLYGVMSYAVGRRRREIGIRMAMGARPGSVERLDGARGDDAGCDRDRPGLAGGLGVIETGGEFPLRDSTARCDHLCCGAGAARGRRIGGVLDSGAACRSNQSD